jgi:hypothetical protein
MLIMKTENLSTLKINRLTQEQFDREKAAGRLEENALYLTPDNDSDSGVYVGSGEMPEDCNVQIDPDGDSYTLEDLKGESGVYVGSGEMPEDCNVQIDPEGDSFTLEDLKGEPGVYVGPGDMPEDYNVQIDPDGDTFTLDELKGTDGKSAYEYAKEGGYNGTEEEFVELFKSIPSVEEHLNDTSNPHEVTAEQVGALPVTGGTITGSLHIKKTQYSTETNPGGLTIETAANLPPEAVIRYITHSSGVEQKIYLGVLTGLGINADFGLGVLDNSTGARYPIFTGKSGVPAEKVTSGTLGGKVIANYNAQPSTDACLRNTSIYAKTDSVGVQRNGEIVWLYE